MKATFSFASRMKYLSAVVLVTLVMPITGCGTQNNILPLPTSAKESVDNQIAITNVSKEEYNIISNVKFYVLIDEYIDNNDKDNPKANISVLVRNYICYDGTNKGYGVSGFTNKIIMPKTDNILSLKSMIKPDLLKLLPNTIVSEKIMNQWHEEGYEPRYEYHEKSTKGLSYNDLRS